MGRFFIVLLAVFALTGVANAQQFFANSRISTVTQSNDAVGTSAAVAIAPASVGGNLLSFKICNDPINTSTYLYVGQATDPSTDGVMLDKGQCFVCENCKGSVLKSMRVIAQAAANNYSIVQYRQ